MTAPGKNSYLGSKQENIENQSGKLEKYQNRKNQNIREMRRKDQVLKYGVQTFLQHSQKNMQCSANIPQSLLEFHIGVCL